MSGAVMSGFSTSEPRIEQVSDAIFAYVQPDGSWWINNAGFLVGSRGIVVVDTASTQRRAEALRDHIAQVSDTPVVTVVNTHHHGDHTNGNFVFEQATVIGHQQCREELLATGLPGPRQANTWDAPQWGELRLSPPTVTFIDGIDLWVDDLACRVQHIGVPAHTTGDSILWIPDRAVLFAGDLVFNGGTPFLLGGSITGMLAAINTLRALQPEIVIPGHGDVCGPESLSATAAYVEFVQAYAEQAHGRGMTPLEAARACDLGEFAALMDAERIVGNLHRAYAELDGHPPGYPIDKKSALADMVRYHGGLLPCHA